MKLQNPRRLLQILRLLAFLFVISLTTYLFNIRDEITHLGVYGYPGIFLFSLLVNATLIIPIPGVLVTSAMGAVFDPFWVAMAAGTGAALGEMSGYLAGFSGQPILERVRWHERVENWMKKYGEITILALAFVPNPVFDLAGLTGGALKMPVHRFLLWCWVGKVLKMMVFAYGGSTILNWLRF